MKKSLAIMTITLATFSLTGLVRAEEPAAKPYPLTTCLVSHEPLGTMGKPVSIVFEGQEFKFCCNQCVKKFNADPAKYTKELAAAAK